jgi:hypothetical protein
MRLVSTLFTPLLFAWSLPLIAQPWQFSQPVDVTAGNRQGVFHHLNSSGRHNIAVSGNTIAVTWEDNRNGTPSVYLARKDRKAAAFAEIKISGNGEAYEPSLTALPNDRFAVAWEEDGKIRLRIIDASSLGPVFTVEGEATQASLATANRQLLLVYTSHQDRYARIRLQRFAVDGVNLRARDNCPVDANAPVDDQLYPTAVSLTDRTVVAWEDRRPGHTIIMAAGTLADATCRFTAPQRISEKSSGPRRPYGKGHGVARVAMHSYGSGQILAAWADKRDFREGYDIYAALYQDKDKLFGKNMKVQDPFGGVAQQWHPAVAGDTAGTVVVAWDDNRDGDPNIMLSWLEDGSWSDDLPVPGASGPGEQNQPTITLDSNGDLHLAWTERQTLNGPTRLRYLYAPLQKNPD